LSLDIERGFGVGGGLSWFICKYQSMCFLSVYLGACDLQIDGVATVVCFAGPKALLLN
jgi:hypothetical protein